MKVYSFTGKQSDVYGFTPDASGANLPATYAPWQLHGANDVDPTDGPRMGVASKDILAGIGKDGYYLASVTITDSAPATPERCPSWPRPIACRSGPSSSHRRASSVLAWLVRYWSRRGYCSDVKAPRGGLIGLGR
jgi:hypothetical protein